jgi:hypothetical protein
VQKVPSSCSHSSIPPSHHPVLLTPRPLPLLSTWHHLDGNRFRLKDMREGRKLSEKNAIALTSAQKHCPYDVPGNFCDGTRVHTLLY